MRRPAASTRGVEAASRYSWERHARAYSDDVEALLAPTCAGGTPDWTSLLVCDLDDALAGCAAGVRRFRRWLERHPDTCFAITTGRSLHSALEVLADWSIPDPDVLISSVGAEIYYALEGSFARAEANADWPNGAARRWPREDIIVALGGAEWLRPQGPREQRPHKLSWFLKDSDRAAGVTNMLARAGLSAEVAVSREGYLDVLPTGVSKGHAVARVAHALGIPMSNVHAAGNPDTDLHMLKIVGRPIVVGDHRDGFEDLVKHPGVHFARSPFANGVLEGLSAAESQA